MVEVLPICISMTSELKLVRQPVIIFRNHLKTRVILNIRKSNAILNEVKIIYTKIDDSKARVYHKNVDASQNLHN